MANEIILKENTELGKSRLGSITQFIIKSLNGDTRSEKARAEKVFTVHSDGLAEKAGFKNTAEWAEKFFGWHKTKTSRLVKSVERFAYPTEATEPLLRNVWADYTLSQMQEMITHTDSEIISAGITPEMSAKQIREALSRSFIDVGEESEESTEESAEAAEESAEAAPYKVTDNLTEMLATVKHLALCGKSVRIQNNDFTYTLYIEE